MGSGPMRRGRSLALLGFTLERSSFNELKKMAKTCPEMKGFIRDHLYERLEVIKGTRRAEAFDLASIELICTNHRIIDSLIDNRPEHIASILDDRPSPPPTARRLFFDEIKEEKENKTQ